LYEKPFFSFGKGARIKKFLQKLEDFDVVHLHYPFFGTAELFPKWKKHHKKIPFVITYHMDAKAKGAKGFIFWFYSKFILNRILNSADKLIATSYDYISHSEASNHFLKNKNKWVEIPLGVDTEKFCIRKKDSNLSEKINIDIEKKTLLFVGGMDEGHYFKGVPVLLNALSKIKDKDFQVILIGDGALKNSFEQQAKDLGLDKKAFFIGGVDKDKLQYYYNLADVFVLPSVNKAEAFGLVLLESLASGVPVIATDLYGVRTIAEKGGVVVPPNNVEKLTKAIKEMLDIKADKESLRQVVEERYSWKSIVIKLEELYKSFN
jgi:rhamnosyl/mannosyltransferase